MTVARLYRSPDQQRALRSIFGRQTGHDADWRSGFWRDRARLIHSPSFRRLQGKTQLFAGLESDFFRNRLTHSLEVAQIAKTIARRLNSSSFAKRPDQLDLDLVEFAGLAHDLGHPPFGHTGEKILDELMRDAGGFEGNAQTLRILTRLEKKLDNPEEQLHPEAPSGGVRPVWYRDGEERAVGLNLCSRSVVSILKYDQLIPLNRSEDEGLLKGYYKSEASVVDRVWRDVLGPASSSRTEGAQVIECQIMDMADDIAYSTYDLEDAFKAGLLTPLDILFPADEILEKVAERVAEELERRFDAKDAGEVLEEAFGFFAEPDEGPPPDDRRSWYRAQFALDYSIARVHAESGYFRTMLTSELVNRSIHAVQLTLDDEVPPLSRLTMKRDQRALVSVLKHLTYILLINSNRMRLVAHRGREIVSRIFDALISEDGHLLLPRDLQRRWEEADDTQRRRVVCDFIAGMTDRYAIEFYARLHSETFYSMFKPF